MAVETVLTPIPRPDHGFVAAGPPGEISIRGNQDPGAVTVCGVCGGHMTEGVPPTALEGVALKCNHCGQLNLVPGI